MNVALVICLFLILTIPTDYELIKERKGEAMSHKKRSATVRALLMILAAAVVTAIKVVIRYPLPTIIWLTYLKSLFLSFAIFFMFFDYSYNIMFHGKTKQWFNYLSKSPLDKLFGKVNWKVRMAIRVAVFVGALIWFLM